MNAKVGLNLDQNAYVVHLYHGHSGRLESTRKFSFEKDAYDYAHSCASYVERLIGHDNLGNGIYREDRR